LEVASEVEVLVEEAAAVGVAAVSAAEVGVLAGEVPAEVGNMKPQHFLSRVEDRRVVEAIKAGEARTSGEIRVFISSRDLGTDDVMHRAVARFRQLGMTRTKQRNGVLLYFIPRARKFAIVGDRAIHEQCGQAFWDEVAADVRKKLGDGEFTEAIVTGVARVAEVMARFFPRQPDDRDELPNAVVRD
jgi:uncharacterized membrane protein